MGDILWLMSLRNFDVPFLKANTVCVRMWCVCVDRIEANNEGNVDDAYDDVTLANTQLTKYARLKVQYTFSPRHVGCVVIYHFKSCN